MRKFIVLTCFLAVAACSDRPNLDIHIEAAAHNQDFPALLPLSQLLADLPAPTRHGIAGLGGLRAKARALRAPVLDAQSRARLINALARHAQ